MFLNSLLSLTKKTDFFIVIQFVKYLTKYWKINIFMRNQHEKYQKNSPIKENLSLTKGFIFIYSRQVCEIFNVI